MSEDGDHVMNCIVCDAPTDDKLVLGNGSDVPYCVGAHDDSEIIRSLQVMSKEDGDSSSTCSATEGTSTEDDAQEKLTRLTVADLNTRYTGKGLYLPESDAEELKNRIETAHSDKQDKVSPDTSDSSEELLQSIEPEGWLIGEPAYSKIVRSERDLQINSGYDSIEDVKETAKSIDKFMFKPLFSRSTITEAIDKEMQRREEKLTGYCDGGCDHLICNQQYGAIQALLNLEEVFSLE